MMTNGLTRQGENCKYIYIYILKHEMGQIGLQWISLDLSKIMFGSHQLFYSIQVKNLLLSIENVTEHLY